MLDLKFEDLIEITTPNDNDSLANIERDMYKFQLELVEKQLELEHRLKAMTNLLKIALVVEESGKTPALESLFEKQFNMLGMTIDNVGEESYGIIITTLATIAMVIDTIKTIIVNMFKAIFRFIFRIKKKTKNTNVSSKIADMNILDWLSKHNLEKCYLPTIVSDPECGIDKLATVLLDMTTSIPTLFPLEGQGTFSSTKWLSEQLKSRLPDSCNFCENVQDVVNTHFVKSKEQDNNPYTSTETITVDEYMVQLNRYVDSEPKEQAKNIQRHLNSVQKEVQAEIARTRRYVNKDEHTADAIENRNNKKYNTQISHRLMAYNLILPETRVLTRVLADFATNTMLILNAINLEK